MSRVIKRYENRKLYDTQDRRYISLEEIAGLIRKGEDVQIVDNSSNEDITIHTLTQVIFEEGKRGRNPLSKEMLHDMIRWGNTVIDEGIEQVRQKWDQFVPASLSKLLGTAKSSEIDQLRQRIESLESLIQKLGGTQGSPAAEEDKPAQQKRAGKKTKKS